MANIKNIQLPGVETPYNLIDGGAVRYDSATSLTAEQKAQARENIGAIDSAMRFIGRATSNIADGATTSASDLGIEGYSARRRGDVILSHDDGRELVWDGSVWEELGKEGSWATADHNHSGVYAPVSHTHEQSDITGLSTALSGKENTSNKVTSISSSSTDTQYPSAKCVYDLVGNIESALDTIRGVS